MSLDEHFAKLDALNDQYRKTKVDLGDCITYERCRMPTDAEVRVVEVWNKIISVPMGRWTAVHTMESWLLGNGFEFTGEGKCSEVFDNGDFVTKILKPEGLRLGYNCYFELEKYKPHQTGYTSRESENDAFILLRKTFLEHILFPVLMSADFQICVQDYLDMDIDRIRSYFGERLVGSPVEVLGPISNLAWSSKQNKAYIIDVW
jgi:hypothetical protein